MTSQSVAEIRVYPENQISVAKERQKQIPINNEQVAFKPEMGARWQVSKAG